jgi:hypothetical protein
MKRIVLVLTLCLALIGQAHAQRYLPGQKGLQFTMGAVDGFRLEKGDKQAFSGGLALSTYTKNGNRWVFGGEYLQKSHLYKTELIPTAQFTLEGGYYYKFRVIHTRYFSSLWGLRLWQGMKRSIGESLCYSTALPLRMMIISYMVVR